MTAFPAFFEQAPTIAVHDGLAELLGAAEGGLIEYRYTDAVRLAGHSCPTVAGAWLMARAALRTLYADRPAERGGIAVAMSEPEDAGTTGVIAQVFTLVTGAAARNGFHGIAGQHVRNGLLSYGSGDGNAIATFRRRDNEAAVAVSMDLSSIPPASQMRALLGQALAPAANAQARHEFGVLWQDRVRRLLLEHADDADVIRVERRG